MCVRLCCDERKYHISFHNDGAPNDTMVIAISFDGSDKDWTAIMMNRFISGIFHDSYIFLETE